MKFTSWLTLIKKSILLDISFLQVGNFQNIFLKIEIILKKYFLLIKHIILQQAPRIGKSRVKIGNKWIYYESQYGLANFQALTVFVNKIVDTQITAIKKPVIIDIGAHLGFFTIPVAEIFKKGIIYACEPVSITFELLHKNCINYPNVIPINIGFLDKEVQKRIYYSNKYLVYSSVLSERFASIKHKTNEKIKLIRLDDFIYEKKIKKIDLLKIDAEGVEDLILKGAPKALSITRFLVVESPMNNLNKIFSILYNPKLKFILYKIVNIFTSESGEVITVDLMFKKY